MTLFVSFALTGPHTRWRALPDFCLLLSVTILSSHCTASIERMKQCPPFLSCRAHTRLSGLVLSAFIEEGNIDALTRCSILLRASSTPPRYQPAAIHEQAHGVSKGQVSYLFKRRTMFPDKFLKPHWLVPRDFLDHLIGAGEKTCRVILRDFNHRSGRLFTGQSLLRRR